MLNVFSTFYGHTWALLPDYYQKAEKVLLDWKDGNNAPKGFNNKLLNQPSLGFVASGNVFNEPMAGGFGNSQVKGVAIIPIFGAMVKRAGMFDDVSGLQSSESVIKYIQQAEQDPNISAIVLHIDSPGGTVDGTEELARVIKEASKYVVSFVDGLAASAALWVASQSDLIVLKGETSSVGSIGVVVQHVDESIALENAGLKVTYITSKKAVNKVKAPSTSPLTEEAHAAISAELSLLGNVFEKAVKSGRKGSLDLAQEDSIFDGSMFYGSNAVKLGLADEINTFEATIRKAARGGKKKATSAEITTSTPQSTNHENNKMKSLLASLSGNKKEGAQGETVAPAASTTAAPAAENTTEQIVATREELATIDAELGKQTEAAKAATAEADRLKAENEKLLEENNRFKAEQARKAGTATETAPPSGDPAGVKTDNPNAGKPSGFEFFSNLQKVVEKL